MEEAGREGAEPGRAGRLGRVRELARAARPRQPLFIAASADLAESTNIAGFGQDFDGSPGTGWYERTENPTARCCRPRSPSSPTPAWSPAWPRSTWPRTRSADSTASGGAASLRPTALLLPEVRADAAVQPAGPGQRAQGRQGAVDRGHSGPETAEDSRTHFGIFSIGVTQLFPEGHVIDLHPWEYNEVPVLGAAFGLDVPIVALHLTRRRSRSPTGRRWASRPTSPRRAGATCCATTSRSARGGTVFVRGTMPTRNLVSVLPELAARGINVKIVAAISPQLFARQPRVPAPVVSGSRRTARRHGHHQRRVQADAGLGRRPWPGVLAVVGLGRPVAHRRLGGRGHRGGAPGRGAHPGRAGAVRRRAPDRLRRLRGLLDRLGAARRRGRRPAAERSLVTPGTFFGARGPASSEGSARRGWLTETEQLNGNGFPEVGLEIAVSRGRQGQPAQRGVGALRPGRAGAGWPG